ncbi:MAG TPA: hypothetical protein VF733_01895 [Candidatus Saccharimonadales bacterium]
MPHYTPLSELPSTIDEENRFAWNLQLPPHLDAERLEINTTRLARFGRIAGLSGVMISEYIGKQTTYEAPGISGMFNDGTAGGTGTAKANKVESYQMKLINTEEELELPPHYQWPVAQLCINRPELTRNIIDNKKDKDDHKVWADQLDKVVRKGLFWATSQVTVAGRLDRNILLSCVGTGALTSGVGFQEPISLGIWAACYAATLYSEREALKSSFHDRRLSFLPWSIQYDRLLLAGVYSTLGFIRDRGEKPRDKEQDVPLYLHS